MINYYYTEKVGDVIEYDFRNEHLIGKGVLIKGDKRVGILWRYKSYPDIILNPPDGPAANLDRIDFVFLGAQKNYKSGWLSVKFKIDNKFFTLTNSKKDGIYKKDPFELREKIDVTVNGEKIDTIDYQSFNENQDKNYEFLIKKDTNLENQNIKFTAHDTYGFLDNLSELKTLNTQSNQNYYINLNEKFNQTIFNIVSYEGNLQKYEEFTFYKSFLDSYIFPHTTKELFRIFYKDNLNNYVFSVPNNLEIKPEIIGYDKNIKKILANSTKIKKNMYSYFVQDSFYYDQKQKIVKCGEDKKYFNEKGVVLPWDINYNEGFLKLDLKINTYNKYIFHIKMKIGNLYKLRGQGGRYQFKEKNNE